MGLLKDIADGNDPDGELYSENAKFKLYRNSFTNQLIKHLQSDEYYGTIENPDVVLAINKQTGERAWVVVNKGTGEIYFDAHDAYEFDFKAKLYKMDVRNERDLINMAESSKKPKKYDGRREK